MKFIDEFRDPARIKEAARAIHAVMPSRPVTIMEVCGTHTQHFYRFGLQAFLPRDLRFVSGPGCPVCVSPQGYIDQAIALARRKNTLILTFGDMLRVPGTRSSLEKERAQGAEVHVLYSVLDALEVARKNPGKRIVFLAVGFETTVPTIALTILRAHQERAENVSFLVSLKRMPPALQVLVEDPRLKIDGFLLPGHVSSIIGMKPYAFIPKRYHIPCCIAGFEPLDILEGIYAILCQIGRGEAAIENQYARVVKAKGNPRAQKIIAQVFCCADAQWRGLGMMPLSGLQIRDRYARFNAEKVFTLPLQLPVPRNPLRGCRCGDVLKGIILPKACRLFAKACTPQDPLGPCMVSYEGACNAYYKYRRNQTT